METTFYLIIDQYVIVDNLLERRQTAAMTLLTQGHCLMGLWAIIGLWATFSGDQPFKTSVLGMFLARLINFQGTSLSITSSTYTR